MSKHKDTCRILTCNGCGSDSDRARIEELERELAAYKKAKGENVELKEEVDRLKKENASA